MVRRVAAATARSRTSSALELTGWKKDLWKSTVTESARSMPFSSVAPGAGDEQTAAVGGVDVEPGP